MQQDISNPGRSAMIRRLQSVFVFGEGPEAGAICKLLGLFVPHSFRCGIDAFEKKVMEGLPADEDSLVVLVSTKRGESAVSELIHQLGLLRFQVQWKGPILLIADPSDVQRVQKWELFTLQQGARYVGQTCLERPVLVSELFSALSTVRAYHPGAWKRLMKTLSDPDAIHKTWELFGQIESEFSKGNWPIDLLNTLYQTLLSPTLVIRDLIGHHGVNTIRRFAGIDAGVSDSVRERSRVDNPEEVIALLREIMARIPQWRN